ncbi:uncharacterized protein LOC126671261 [Mercurialis annua]|uniref:uncharacterized protein LOC126671261 n=1 Tax=Mercurialis annua TaxID=3986 RepID=UPI00215FA3F7|nr:uncharacterized protein LOC126671261 [Mercurialis annua]
MGTYSLLQLSSTKPHSLALLSPLTIPNSTTKIPFGLYYQINWKNSPAIRPIRINFEDELYTDPDDEFGFSGTRKQRVWWSNYNDYEEEDDDDDDDDDVQNEFWVFKVIRAFGWMVPAIGISLLLGTGPNPFLMALAVPLGQTAISLVIDRVWGTASSRPRSSYRTRSKTRRKPFVRPTSRERTSKEQDDRKTREEKQSYSQSWTAASDGVSFKKGGHKFGGWDELDNMHKVPKEKARQTTDEFPKQQQRQAKVKLGRTRGRDKPLFVRLLIAIFPFLGSWSRFIF